MEVISASEDDCEPAKDATAGQGLSGGGGEAGSDTLGDTEAASEDTAETGLERTFAQLTVGRDQLIVVIDGEQLVCDEKLLASECRYFEAFTHFERSKHLEIRGAISYGCFKTITDFLGSSGGELDISVVNFQELLQVTVWPGELPQTSLRSCRPPCSCSVPGPRPPPSPSSARGSAGRMSSGCTRSAWTWAARGSRPQPGSTLRRCLAPCSGGSVAAWRSCSWPGWSRWSTCSIQIFR